MIRRNIFEVSEDEKRRILGLHESAAKRHYLIKEQETTGGTPTNKTSPNPSGVENTLISDDGNYTYLGVVPTSGEQNPKNAADVVANPEVAYVAVTKDDAMYRAIPTETNDQGVPTKFSVDTQHQLPIFSATKPGTTLKLGIQLTDSGEVKINKDADPATSKAYVRDRTAEESLLITRNDKSASSEIGMMFLVDYYGDPRMVFVNLGKSQYSRREIKELGVGEYNTEYLLTVNENSAAFEYGKGGIGVMFKAGTPFGGYVLISKPITPVKKENETVPIKFEAPGDDLFDFNSADLKGSANQYIDKLVNDIKLVYKTHGSDVFGKFLNFLNSQNLQVKGYSSGDGDPAAIVPANTKNGCPKSARQNYDLCLSQKRADAVANAITNKLTGLKLTAKGMGYGTEVPNWTKESPTTPDKTAKNRKFILDIPTFNITVKK